MTNSLATKEDLVDLFNELNESLYNYFFFRVFYNKEVAEDLTSELFIKIWEKRTQFDSTKSNLKTWVYSIARNHLIDFIRKEAKENNKITINNNFLSNLQGSSNVEDSQLYEFIIKSLSKISDLERELIVLRYIVCLEITEIAEIQKKSYEATKVAIYRAIQKLKNRVNGE